MKNAIQSMFKIFTNSDGPFYNDNFNEVDQSLIRYFRIEYGKEWQIALEHRLYKENIKKNNKAV